MLPRMGDPVINICLILKEASRPLGRGEKFEPNYFKMHCASYFMWSLSFNKVQMCSPKLSPLGAKYSRRRWKLQTWQNTQNIHSTQVCYQTCFYLFNSKSLEYLENHKLNTIWYSGWCNFSDVAIYLLLVILLFIQNVLDAWCIAVLKFKRETKLVRWRRLQFGDRGNYVVSVGVERAEDVISWSLTVRGHPPSRGFYNVHFRV